MSGGHQLRVALGAKQIAGMRDRLTQGYFGVDLGLVWRVVERDLQTLDAAVDALLSTPDAGT